MADTHVIPINVQGQQYPIRTSLPPEYVLQLAPGGSASFSGSGEVIGRNQTMVTALCDR